MIHCDIKPENVLFKDLNFDSVIVIDFGSATFISDVEYTYLQTRPYRAPEMVFGYPFDFAADMWSLGCVLYEIVTKRILFNFKRTEDNIAKAFAICSSRSYDIFKEGKNYDSLIQKNQICRRNKSSQHKNDLEIVRPNYNYDIIGDLISMDCDFKLIDFIKKCLEVDPSRRMTVEEAFDHDFILD